MKRVLQLAVLRTPAELEAIGPEWRQLTAATADPSQTHEWQMAAASCLHQGERLRVLIVRDGAKLAAAAPLVETRRRGMAWLEMLGARVLHEPTGLPADAPDAQEALCEAILAQRMPAVLQRLDSQNTILATLAGAARGRSVLVKVSGGTCLRVDMTGTWQDFERHMPSSHLSNLKRRRRKMEEQGAVVVEYLTPEVDEVTAALRVAFEVEGRSWKGASGSAVLQRPDLWDFFVEVGRRFASLRQLEVRLLRVGGAIAASEVGILRGGRWWGLKIGYDQEWARFSPGQQLVCEGIHSGFERHLAAYEFLGTAESWQRPLASSDSKQQTLVLYPINGSGMTALALDAVAHMTARLISMSRLKKWRRSVGKSAQQR